ncbi:MAG: AAA family ATPase, partial [Oscillospiraceae bacterium]|nr:AAA family ATPase [Oscillospiraceae bacterium]
MRYPVGVQTFEEMINGNYVYVDKTDLVYDLAQSHICFLSRPRRFGKSLLISTLEAYFSGKKELFKNLKIDILENDWTEYPVLRFDFARGNYKKAGELNQIIEEQLYDYEKLYGRDENYKTLSGRFLNLIKTAEEKTGRKVVVLIDEYDKPMLDVLGKESEQT